MTPMRSHVVTILASLAAALGILGLWGYGTGFWNEPGYNVEALVPEAARLAPGASVRVAGLQVGRVAAVEQRGTGAVIRLEIEDDHAPIPRDSQFAVRLRTLVGENYVEVYPGRSAQDLPDGGTLPPSHVKEYVEADEILSTLRGPARERAREMIQGLGDGVGSHGRELNAFLAQAGRLPVSARPSMRVFRRNRHKVARLTDNFGRLWQAIGDRGDELRSFALTSRVTFQAMADRDAALRAMLDEFPPTLRRVRSTTGTLRTITGRTAPVLTDLAHAVTELKPSIDLLRPAAQQGRALLSELEHAAPQLRGTLRRARAASGPTADALPQVRRTLCELNPMAAYLAPYAREAGALVADLASFSNYYDANGHAARLFITAGRGLHGAANTREVDAALDLLVRAGLVGEGGHDGGYNPFPGPGQIHDLKPTANVTGPAEVEEPYPRVEAEC